MILNFETYTVEISDIERKMVDVIIDRFRQKPGIENIVTNKQMCAGLKKHFDIDLSEPRIRKIIQFIRVNNLLPGLIGTSKGYYYTENIDEIKMWIESMMQRERSIAESRAVAQNHVWILERNGFPKQMDIELLF